MKAIIALAGLSDVPTEQVLDCCHAVHHISRALASLGLDREERNPLYRQHRSLLRKGLPCGSGAIESGIRRVINLRLKSNAMFWKSSNAESMLQVRSQVVSDQWDTAMMDLSEFRRTQAYDDWRWEPKPMSSKVETTQAAAV